MQLVSNSGLSFSLGATGNPVALATAWVEPRPQSMPSLVMFEIPACLIAFGLDVDWVVIVEIVPAKRRTSIEIDRATFLMIYRTSRAGSGDLRK